MLVYCPRKLVVQLPRNTPEHNGAERQNAGHGNKEWLDIGPEFGPDLISSGSREEENRIAYLICLNSRIDHQAQVIQAQPNDLNGVLQA